MIAEKSFFRLVLTPSLKALPLLKINTKERAFFYQNVSTTSKTKR